jgi:hypothetical protein
VSADELVAGVAVVAGTTHESQRTGHVERANDLNGSSATHDDRCKLVPQTDGSSVPEHDPGLYPDVVKAM